MPATEDYEYKFWFQTPEPVSKPGYTGYIPEFGPRRIFQYGKTYGKMTHELFLKHPVAGLRLAPMLDNSDFLQKKLEDEVLTWKHEVTTQNPKYRRDMVSGYTGYIPRRKFIPGKAFNDECKEAIALAEKLKILRDE